MRAIYQFGKTARLQCVSHLDLQRFMQMALRRTRLPIAYSQGFNPHPLLSFASALAMGWTSDAELMDIKLDKPIGKGFAMEQMSGALPPDLPLKAVRLVDDRFPALMARLCCAAYTVDLEGDAFTPVVEAVPGFLADDTVIAVRRTKSGEHPTNIRPMAHQVAAYRIDTGYRMELCLDLTEQATLKPDLLLQTLAQRAGTELPDGIHIHRTALLGRDGSGNLADLFTLKA